MKIIIAPAESVPPRPLRSEVREGPEVDMTCLPRDRVGVHMVGSGDGVGALAEPGRHGTPTGAAFARPWTLAATTGEFRQPPTGPLRRPLSWPHHPTPQKPTPP